MSIENEVMSNKESSFHKFLVRGIPALWYFIWGNIFALFIYKRKYLRGKYFESRYFGIGAIGWNWVYMNFPFQAFFRINSDVPWPVSPRVMVGYHKNVIFHPDDLNNFQTTGVYFQGIGAKLVIGKGTWIAANVGLITQNHNIYDPDERAEAKAIIIGQKCWIGMNAMLLPGVVLGPHTVVGAGAVVTKSFPDGYCVIAGSPAIITKKLEKSKCGSTKKRNAE